MQPMPRDILKNASPMAIMMTEASTRSHWGMNRKRKPSEAPGRVRLRMQTPTSRRKRTGIRTRVTFSMPAEAPRMMMAPVSSRTSHCQNSDTGPSFSKEEKLAWAAAGSVDETVPVADLRI